MTVADSGKVDKTKLADGGIQYDIYNQQVNKGSALNKFTDFGIGQKDVANLQLGSSVDRQINLVKNRIDIDGVVNAIKDNKIGGDVYFFSDAGIAVGATGVFNVGRLTLGTNAAYGEALYNGGMEKHLAQSAASQAKAVAGVSDITFQGKVYAQGDVVLGAGSVNVKGGEIRTHRNNADTYADKKAVEAYRNQLVNVSPSATVAKAL
ncbi:MAG: leukotoxin LktA family filamentous adhesin, partial [Dialister sp.]|nr:leukotoxin LktA family filamentous adhesin [Dialister sp.]